jgi:hypothetical protein
MSRILIATFLSLLAFSSAAQVYRHVDEEGNVTFTDRPSPGAEPVEIRDTNVTPPPPAIPRAEAPAPGPQVVDGSYEVSISTPANETIIPNGPGNFTVSASVSPALGKGDLLQMKIDGSAHGEPQVASSWALTNIFRGEHHLTVAVVNEKGKELATSAPITVFVYRPSTNNNNRNRPVRPPVVRPPRPTPR